MRKYFGNWESRECVAQDFKEGAGNQYTVPFVPAEDFPTDDEMLLAAYGYGSYDGDAFVLYQRNGKLYEVHGSHCSCYGLEDQWIPEETTWEALKMRKAEHLLSSYSHEQEARNAYNALLAAHE